jgi:hypothetical protein
MTFGDGALTDGLNEFIGHSNLTRERDREAAEAGQEADEITPEIDGRCGLTHCLSKKHSQWFRGRRVHPRREADMVGAGDTCAL